jgi:hypothetical protein
MMKFIWRVGACASFLSLVYNTQSNGELASVELGWQQLTTQSFVVAFNRCGQFALAFGGRFFIKLACTQFG